jgi:opacity protein-like surface antigen
MKRFSTFLTGLLLLAVPAALSAQGGVGLGIKGGAAFGNVSNKGVLPGELGSRTGFAFGLSIGSKSGLLGFGAEGLYDQSGVTSDTDLDARKLDYVDVPVYVRVMLPTPGIRPFGYLGPQASFEVSCKAGSSDCPDTEPSGEKRAKTTYAGVIGAGAQLGGRTPISIEARYVYGLTDLKLGTVTSSESYKTRTLIILAGYHF